MLISVPVLSDRLKSKQALPWAPLPNSRQTNTSIKKGIFPPQFSRFPPSFAFLAALLILPYRPFWVPLIDTASIALTHCPLTYIHAHIELPLTLPPPPTGPCFVSLGGLAAIEPSVPFASRVIYKQYMDAVHTPTFHPPTLSHFSSTDTQSPLWGASVCQKTTQQGDGLFFSHLFQRMYPVYLRMLARHPRLGWMRLLCQPEEKLMGSD